MSNILEISVDRRSLVATLYLTNKDERVFNELKIICSSISDNYSYSDLVFKLPWFELKRGLTSIAHVRKKYKLDIKYDAFAKRLVEETVNDRKSIKEKKSAVDINEDILNQILKKNNFNRKLKAEQKRDVLHLLRLKHGANFSVPGAGKTTTILATHTVLKQLGIVSKLFVIAPINAFISWQDEVDEIFGKGALIIKRLQRNHTENFSLIEQSDLDIILVNYEKLRKDVSQLIPFFINNKVHLILDESHRIKSGTNNISYGQIIKLADLAKRRDILSGTPMPQSYTDLEPQFDFLWPGENIIPEHTRSKDEDILPKVNQAINGLFVRTTKNELGLEDPIIDYTLIPMGKIQAELYRLFKSEAARVISGMDKPSIYNFRRIGRSVVKLLQAATNPILLTAKDEYGEETLSVPQNREFWELLEDFQKYEKPVKIEYIKIRVKKIIEENPTNKILIWSYFVRNILILKKLLKEYNPVVIYGEVPSGSEEDEKTREYQIREFHENPECKVMIANPQACGEGISLHKVCHYAIYLDRNFNAAFFLQSIDRIHRLGLEKGIVTKIEILITENTIDEVLIDRLNDKIKAMGNVLEDPYLSSLAYDPADISIEDEVGIDSVDFEVIKKHIIHE
ncbi:DEAD/DEAH box helicase [Parapedobacter tibetensis]|uniref:DEAD/DEAH box helicase n=1 Tax=Parapedobacter tibetensis TaxID=2972951 RepID=UPI00214D3E86|nr:DEAD/DEAH box helicase [Parapedobacter tibetensis]